MSKFEEVINFDNDSRNLPKNINFHAAKSSLQQQLMEDLRTIKNTKTTLSPKRAVQKTTVKPVYNGHTGDEVSAVHIDRWLL